VARSALTRPALRASRISKRFGRTRALDDAELRLFAGEVHALLGENGSGKSTLVKVLSGIHEPEPEGVLEMYGRPLSLPLSPARCRELGLSVVHQELGLADDLSVADNLLLPELAVSRSWWLSPAARRRRARRLLSRLDLGIDPSARVGALEPAERAQLALARAVGEAAEEGHGAARGVLLLDEPTAYLAETESERLFELVRAVAAEGAAVLLVTHDLDDALRSADGVTVLRDGRTVAQESTRRLDRGRLLELVIGRPIEPSPAAERTPAQAGAAVTVADLSGGGLSRLTLEIQAGEIVGLTGPPGSGFEQVPAFLFGAAPAQSGRLRVGGRALDVRSLRPDTAVAAGIALVPGDQRHGSVASLSLTENVTLPTLGRYGGALLDRRRMRTDTSGLIERFDVRPARPELALGALSSGNQQKAVLAKWVALEPSLLLLDEPTRGVDVGARRRITALVRELAARGACVLCASADHEQLASLCDRVLVFAGGGPARELIGAEVTEERIATECHRIGLPR
jgi:ribose transport system ATP-binding protein